MDDGRAGSLMRSVWMWSHGGGGYLLLMIKLLLVGLMPGVDELDTGLVVT